MREVFSIDKDFSEKKFEKQMAVVRGQALNLASAMRFGLIPGFTLMTRVYAVKKSKYRTFIPHRLIRTSLTSLFRICIGLGLIYHSKLQNMTEPVTYSKSAG